MAIQQEQKDAGAPALAEADDFAALLKQNFKPRSERAASEVESAVQTLVTQALSDSSVVKGDVIERVQDKPVTTPAEVMAELTSARAANREYVMMLILPAVRDTTGPKWFALQAGPVLAPGESHADVP